MPNSKNDAAALGRQDAAASMPPPSAKDCHWGDHFSGSGRRRCAAVRAGCVYWGLGRCPRSLGLSIRRLLFRRSRARERRWSLPPRTSSPFSGCKAVGLERPVSAVSRLCDSGEGTEHEGQRLSVSACLAIRALAARSGNRFRLPPDLRRRQQMLCARPAQASEPTHIDLDAVPGPTRRTVAEETRRRRCNPPPHSKCYGLRHHFCRG